MKRLITHDPLTGISTYFIRDPVTGDVAHQSVQDVTEVIERNKSAQNESVNKRSEMWPVATVPFCILHQWAQDAGVSMNDKAFGEVVKKKLNDPDFRAFRTGVFKL